MPTLVWKGSLTPIRLRLVPALTAEKFRKPVRSVAAFNLLPKLNIPSWAGFAIVAVALSDMKAVPTPPMPSDCADTVLLHGDPAKKYCPYALAVRSKVASVTIRIVLFISPSLNRFQFAVADLDRSSFMRPRAFCISGTENFLSSVFEISFCEY